MPKLGLAGAHRTGKTTLARAFAERTDCNFVTISMTEILASEGLEPKDIKDPDTRLRVQRKAVERCDRVFGAQRSDFISDRTPLDVAAYTMADAVQGFYTTPAQQAEVVRMMYQCIDITNTYFNGIVFVRPTPEISYVEEPGKPLSDIAYQKHHDMLVLAHLSEEVNNIPFWIMRAVDLEKRVEALENVASYLMEDDISACEVVALN